MLLEKLRGSEIKTRLLNPHEEYWDRKLGIHTFGYHPGTDRSNPEHFNYYMPASYTDMFKFLKLGGLTKDDVFVDVGSGMGRAVFLASYLGAKRSVGVELIPWLHDVAEENRRDGNWPNVEFYCGDGREIIIPDVTLLALFNPFGPAIMEEMLAKLKKQRKAPLRILYVNPFHEDVLERSGWLTRTSHVRKSKNLIGNRLRFPVSVWESV